MREEDLALRRRQPRIGPRTDPALLEQVVEDKLACALRAVALKFRLKAIDERIVAPKAPRPLTRDEERQLTELGTVLVPLPTSWAQKVLHWTRAHVFAGSLAGRGVETEPHVTVKYGLTTLNDADVVAAIARVGPLTVELGRMAVVADDEVDVLMILVTSPGLVALRKRIERQASRRLPSPRHAGVPAARRRRAVQREHDV